jgi:hypothetical protein
MAVAEMLLTLKDLLEKEAFPPPGHFSLNLKELPQKKCPGGGIGIRVRLRSVCRKT